MKGALNFKKGASFTINKIIIMIIKENPCSMHICALWSMQLNKEVT